MCKAITQCREDIGKKGLRTIIVLGKMASYHLLRKKKFLRQVRSVRKEFRKLKMTDVNEAEQNT